MFSKRTSGYHCFSVLCITVVKVCSLSPSKATSSASLPPFNHQKL